jgi:predicted GH43/DUF377 family glycosyl hydrolase
MQRREWLQHAALATATLTGSILPRRLAAADERPFRVHQWQRDEKNPVLPNGGGSFDVGCCMNPFVVVRGDEYWMFYAGAENKGARRICLATCPIDRVTEWKRHGPLFDLGKPDAFDGSWCVLPCVHKFGDKWHLYYSSRSNDQGVGLQGFRGIGLAVSDDLRNWKKYSDEPILLGDGFAEFPDNKGIAGGGPIIEVPGPDGRTIYRMYYTLPTGRPSKDLLVDQAKYAVTADSTDGFTWTNRRIVLGPRLEAKYENAAAIALNPWKTERGWRAIYAGIGTQFGSYSICEAASDDGLTWYRGRPGENLALAPQGTGWESRMTEYPHVVREGKKLRLFYCGNGYGATGIGTAVADPIV